MEPSSRGVAEGQEPETATSLVCSCWVGVGHEAFCLHSFSDWKCSPFMLYLSTVESTPATHSPILQTIFSFHPLCLPFHHDSQLVLMHFLGIDLPILSVRAITIRLWIISLDHCFPLLCWLGAIRPPFSWVTATVKLPVPFPPLPSLLSSTSSTPVTPHNPHLSSSAPQHLLKSKLSAYRPFRTGETPYDSPILTLTFTSADSQMIHPSHYLWRKSQNDKQGCHITTDSFSWQRLTGAI